MVSGINITVYEQNGNTNMANELDFSGVESAPEFAGGMDYRSIPAGVYKLKCTGYTPDHSEKSNRIDFEFADGPAAGTKISEFPGKDMSKVGNQAKMKSLLVSGGYSVAEMSKLGKADPATVFVGRTYWIDYTPPAPDDGTGDKKYPEKKFLSPETAQKMLAKQQAKAGGATPNANVASAPTADAVSF